MVITTTIATLASSDLAKRVLEPLAKKMGAEGIGVIKEKWRKYTHSFDRYLSEVESKHKYFSSQVFANEGQLLEDYYIPLTLQKGGSSAVKSKIVVDSYPSDLMAAYKDVLIVDTAGMGKSTLLKFIFLRSLHLGEYIPVFVELRKLSKEKTIWNFMLEELKLAVDELNQKFLRQCINEGIFIFFLDGFDEIPDDDKQSVSSQIIDLKAKSAGCRFILSSREEQSLSYLAEFHRFNIKPLSPKEAFDLMRKITPDPKVAASLIDKVQEQPNNSLNEFLTNPLLVSLLVKSFLHSPILPVRLSEFYRQVFDALFQNHDAKKELGGFTRKKRSGLDLDRFHKALRALGVLSYRDNKLEFSVDELLNQIEIAKQLTSDSAYSASNLRHDLLHAVPLFVQEGTSSRWAHRSLQEYFAAAYICVDAKDDQAVLLEQLYNAGVAKNANLLKLCADIDGKTFKHVLVKKYLSDRISQIEKSFGSRRFPDIGPKTLSERRAIISDFADIKIIVLPRVMSLEKAREYALKQFPGKSIDQQFIPFSAQGAISATGELKVKYFVSIFGNKFLAMDSIIATYFNEKIVVRESLSPIRSSLKNVPFGQILEFNDEPENPLNSKENFTTMLRFVKNISTYVDTSYDLRKMKSLYESVCMHETNALNLTIRFA